MKDLSIAQEYMICTANGEGAIAGYNQKAVACLIVSGLLEMQLAKCISLNDKNVSVCAAREHGVPEAALQYYKSGQTYESRKGSKSLYDCFYK